MSDTAYHQALRTGFGTMIPHVSELGIELLQVDAEAASARLPVRPDFIGDPERARVHTGVITALIDSVMGVAVLARAGAPVPIATLDLRVDHLHAADDGHALHCRAVCYRLSTHIAFVRAEVWQTDATQPVTTAQATFMLNSRRRRPTPPA